MQNTAIKQKNPGRPLGLREWVITQGARHQGAGGLRANPKALFRQRVVTVVTGAGASAVVIGAGGGVTEAL